MKMWGKFFIIVMFLLTGCNNPISNPTPVDDGFTDILWVGDDQLLTGPLDMQTLLLMELGGNSDNLRMKRAISPRFTLSTPFEEEEFLKTTDFQSVEFVIIQAFGVNRNFSKDDFVTNARSWIDFFKTHKSEVIVLYPWFSAVDTELEKIRLDKMIHQLVWQEGLILVPVGPAWQSAIENNPGINLHASNGIHPSAEGVYLSACVFYASLTGDSPIDHPVYTSVGFDSPDEIIKLKGDTLHFLQEIAWDTIDEYVQKDEFGVIIKK